MPDSLLLTRQVVLAALLAASAVTDWYERRILNALTYPAILSGILLAFASDHAAGWSALLGATAGAGALAPLWRAGGMGLGDVKLLAAVGALEGFLPAMAALVVSLLFGGAMALAVATRRGELVATLRRSVAFIGVLAGRRPLVRGGRGAPSLPFGVAIAAGTAMAWGTGWPW